MSNYDTSFIVNNETGRLKPIRISLPKPPKKLSAIANFGLPVEEQYFKREQYPEKLKALEKEVRAEFFKREKDSPSGNFRATGQVILEEIWDRISNSTEYYEKEIEWIKKQWWHRLNGYFFYNNGKITYIDGWHWFYLNYWYMGDIEGGHPEYRDRDRRQFLFMRYAYDTTETFKDVDDKGNALKNSKGVYEMIEMPGKVCMGVVQPKNRRGGNTHIGLCIEFEILSRAIGDVYGGNQSYTEAQIRGAYEKLMGAWEKMPFFFKPVWKGENRPAGKIQFVDRKGRDSLGSTISYAETGESTFYDGLKLLFLLSDEEGKTEYINILQRWGVNMHTLSTGAGSNIFGFSYHPSTVSESCEAAALNFKTMVETSDFYQRNANGNTQTFLFTLFFPAWDCLEKHIDKYGNAIVDEPTEEQRKNGYNGVGSRKHIQSQKDAFLGKDDSESARALIQLRKLFPFDLDDCFMSTSGDTGMDIDRIDKRLLALSKTEPQTQRFDMAWESGVKDSKVILIPNSQGRFLISKILPSELANRKIQERVIDRQNNELKLAYRPYDMTSYIAGGDPYKYGNQSEAKLREDKRRLSDGGGAVLWRRDKSVDPSDLITDWKSFRFVCTYCFRPSSQYEYCEDMIMMCHYYGAMMFPENNIPDLWKHFLERGYGGYLAYAIDKMTGKPKEKPGWHSGTDSKQSLFEKNRQYIKDRVHMEVHDDYLMQCKKIRGIEYMTDFDLFTACGGALLGDELSHIKFIDTTKSNKVVLNKTIFGKRTYRG